MCTSKCPQKVIGVDMTFCQILDKILIEGPSQCFGKPEGLPMIKSKPYGQKIKKLNHNGE
jgi:hypothetical protein